MGGLYISPSSSEISWKRRAVRVSSEALLCLGVATIVASFVVDIGPNAQKPNIWILMGGLIMIVASAIGWSLTFCLMFDSDAQAREDNTFTGIVVSHTKDIDLPGSKIQHFNNNSFQTNNSNDSSNNLIHYDLNNQNKVGLGFLSRAFSFNQDEKIIKKDKNGKIIKTKVKKMKAVDKNAPLHSVEVIVPKAFLQQGGNIATLPDKLSPNMFDQFFSNKNLISGSNLDLMNNSQTTTTTTSSNSEYSNNSQLAGYSKMPGNYDPEVAQKLGKIPPIPKDSKKLAGYNDDTLDKRHSKEITDTIAKERERARSAKPKNNKINTNKTQNNTGNKQKQQNNNNKRRNEKEKISSKRSDTDSSSITNTYSTETETLSNSSYTDSRTTQSSKTNTTSYSDSYNSSQDYEEVQYNKRGERIRSKKNNRNDRNGQNNNNKKTRDNRDHKGDRRRR